MSVSTEVAKCVGVVDGGMLILDGGQTVTLAGVQVPRVGVPGGSVLRTVLQRHVQDKEITYELVGKDRMGYPSITVKANDQDLASLINQALKDYGYAS